LDESIGGVDEVVGSFVAADEAFVVEITHFLLNSGWVLSLLCDIQVEEMEPCVFVYVRSYLKKKEKEGGIGVYVLE